MFSSARKHRTTRTDREVQPRRRALSLREIRDEQTRSLGYRHRVI
jgi:hypothetical protein